MPDNEELRSTVALTRKYYARLRELLAEVPSDRLGWRSAPAALTAGETARHVCEADRWYIDLIGGGSHSSLSPPDRHEPLQTALTETEAEMLTFLQEMDETTLAKTAEVPGWWGEGKPQPARLILAHSLAHKYYHCGQLQALLHAMADLGQQA
ncbi:MAG: DUF664 domain-containing protein [Armatimonadetes bacterium]|nr:DUF664 domain-containing protein [Armatimonadota bacterium]